jgi:hypothetical protein
MNAHVENQNHGSTGVRNARISFYHKGTAIAPSLAHATWRDKLGLGGPLSLGRIVTPAARLDESRHNYAAVWTPDMAIRHCQSQAEPITP